MIVESKPSVGRFLGDCPDTEIAVYVKSSVAEPRTFPLVTCAPPLPLNPLAIKQTRLLSLSQRETSVTVLTSRTAKEGEKLP
jgi:hypothetical protein